MKANQLNPDFKEFIELLNVHAVEYLIVDAFAVARYGVVQNTGDIDVWVNQTNETWPGWCVYWPHLALPVWDIQWPILWNPVLSCR